MSSVRSTGAPSQEIRFCRAPDGVRIAYAVHGSGPPLLIGACWLSHLQYDWESPVWRHFLDDLGKFATVIRYDERGHGLSDWDVDEFGLEARVGDIEAVVEHAGLERFAVMAMSQGGPPVIAYAHRHPERISRLLFYGSYAAARRRERRPEEEEMSKTFEQLIKVGWDRPDSAFRRVLTSQLIPDSTEEQMRWIDGLLRMSTSSEVALKARRQRAQANTVDLLPDLDVPTLVLHSRDDRMNGFDSGLHLAATIPGARFVPLESSNHIVLADEPAWQVFVDEVARFMEPDRIDVAATPHAGNAQVLDLLSPRELEVLRLAADGCDNEAIAGRLYISARTVERHLHNVYTKLGVEGKAARTAAVARLLTST